MRWKEFTVVTCVMSSLETLCCIYYFNVLGGNFRETNEIVGNRPKKQQKKRSKGQSLSFTNFFFTEALIFDMTLVLFSVLQDK